LQGSSQRSPDSLAVFKVSTSKGRRGRGREGRREKDGEEKGRERREDFPLYKILNTPLVIGSNSYHVWYGKHT